MTHTKSDHPAPLTFVLVHGAWHGGWCWDSVVHQLRALGHKAYAPTLTGLGERSHLLDVKVGLETHIQDVMNVIEYEGLTDVVLVGHSYGGVPAIGAASRCSKALRCLVMLDALVLDHGENVFCHLPPSRVSAHLTNALRFGQGHSIPVPAAESFGVVSQDHKELIEARCTPHPLKTYEDSLVAPNASGMNVPKIYVYCSTPSYEPLARSRARVQARPDWAWTEIATGHNAMMSAPDLLVQKLLDLAAGRKTNQPDLERPSWLEPTFNYTLP